MKKLLFLIVLALICQIDSFAQSQMDWASSWKPLFVFLKDSITEGGSLQKTVFDIDTLNPQKKIAFYGNWDKARLYDQNGKNPKLISNAPNAIFIDGTSAGEIKFNPSYSYSTISNHTYYNGIEYIGIYNSDSSQRLDPHSIVLSLRDGKFERETSIMFDGGRAYIYPIGNNKFFLPGSYFDGWDHEGKKTLKGAAIWDKNLNTLNPISNGGLSQPKKISTSQKDGTIFVITTNNYYRMYKIFWYGQEQFMDSLYPIYPDPSLPENGRIDDIYVIDRYNMYAVWNNFDPPYAGQILRLDFAQKKWVKIATMNSDISSITGDGKDHLFISGPFNQINGAPVSSCIQSYSISTGQFKDMPYLPRLNPASDYQRGFYRFVRLNYVAGNLFAIYSYDLPLEETVYQLKLSVTPIVILKNFSGEKSGTANMLSWTSSTEVESSKFEIERSTAGENYVTLGPVSAAGNSSTEVSYTFTDYSPPQAQNRYRLKMIMINGQSSYSEVVTIDNSVVTSIPTPVVLTSFTAKTVGSSNVLNWSTAQESGSDYFAVERSPDGSMFQTIHQIEAAGTTSSPSLYSFTDAQPANGINFYRLRMVDTNGKTEYSSTIKLDNTRVEIDFMAYPNPVKNEVSFKLPANRGSLKIINSQGQIIVSKIIDGSSSNEPINTSNWSKGFYIVIFQEKISVKTLKILKE